MEWTPSDKMTITDLRAVLASWDIPTLSNDKPVLIKEVTAHYREIMLTRMNRRPAVPSFVSGLPVFAPGVARSSGGDDKSIGTDCPRTEHNYIGSDEPARDDDDDAIGNMNLDLLMIRDFEAACAADDDDYETFQVDDAGNVIGRMDEPAQVESAACAAAEPDELALPVVRSTGLRRALELEEEATAKVRKARDKAKDKANDKKAVAKSKSKIYGYLPMAGVFIDENQKKGDDKDKDDVFV